MGLFTKHTVSYQTGKCDPAWPKNYSICPPFQEPCPFARMCTWHNNPNTLARIYVYCLSQTRMIWILRSIKVTILRNDILNIHNALVFGGHPTHFSNKYQTDFMTTNNVWDCTYLTIRCLIIGSKDQLEAILICDKTSYREISSRLEAPRIVFRISRSFWYFTTTTPSLHQNEMLI